MVVNEHADAPGRGLIFEPDLRSTFFCKFIRGLYKVIAFFYFRPSVRGRDQIPATGPVIIAPIHRSLVDFGFAVFMTKRKLFFMAKDSLWKSEFFGSMLVKLGAFPVHRESADREALTHAEAVLKAGGVLILFPEGARRTGENVSTLMEGAAFLSARTGAPVIPVGIGGSEKAMPVGKKMPRPVKVFVTIDEPIPAPERSEGGRVRRSQIHQLTATIEEKLQEVYDASRMRGRKHHGEISSS